VPDDAWQADLDLKLFGAIRASRAAVPHLRQAGGGSIVNLLNLGAKQPGAKSVPTSVSRAAGMALMKALSKELAPDNIRVNCINPGLVLTRDWVKTAKELTQGTSTTWQQHLDKIAKDNAPVGRFASPEEIANLFVFLCSSQASYCTGSTYGIDGGWLRSPD